MVNHSMLLLLCTWKHFCKLAEKTMLFVRSIITQIFAAITSNHSRFWCQYYFQRSAGQAIIHTKSKFLKELLLSLKWLILPFLPLPIPTTSLVLSFHQQDNSDIVYYVYYSYYVYHSKHTEVYAFELQAFYILNEVYAQCLCTKLAAQKESSGWEIED